MNEDLILPELPPGYRYRKEGEFQSVSQYRDHEGDIDIFLDIPITEKTEYENVIRAWVHVKELEANIRNVRTSAIVYKEGFTSVQEALNVLVVRLCLNEF